MMTMPPETESKAEVTFAQREQALAKMLGLDLPKVEAGDENDGRFLLMQDTIELEDRDGRRYLVLTEEEADKRAAEAIENSLWAFNSDFLIEFLGLPWAAEKMLSSFQENECEGANETIRAMIGSRFEEFAKEAIEADGRGHFLAQYDHEENEEQVDGIWFFIYRVN